MKNYECYSIGAGELVNNIYNLQIYGILNKLEVRAHYKIENAINIQISNFGSH